MKPKPADNQWDGVLSDFRVLTPGPEALYREFLESSARQLQALRAFGFFDFGHSKTITTAGSPGKVSTQARRTGPDKTTPETARIFRFGLGRVFCSIHFHR